MTIIQWNHAEVQRAATDAAYAAASLNGVSVHSPATGSKAQATLDEKIQGLKQAITDIATKAKTTSENLTPPIKPSGTTSHTVEARLQSRAVILPTPQWKRTLPRRG